MKRVGNVHTSVYELAVQEINRINLVDEAEVAANIIDLALPVVDPMDNFVDILFSLLTTDQTPLSFFGPERELVFSIGGQESIVTLGADKTLRFENIEHLRFIDSEDLLAIRLYANNDAANILWEYEFGLNGLHVAYQIPDTEEDVTTLLETTVGGNTLVRNLGGMRLKYRYQPPSGETIQTIAWEFNAAGWFCNQAGYEGGTGCTHVAADTQHVGFASAAGERFVWWEPSTGGTNPESRWENGITITGNYSATTEITTNGQTTTFNRSSDFDVITRELQHLAADPNNPQAPMNGVDVKILENLLWQLGVSPSAKPGIDATRLAVDKRRVYEINDGSVGRMVGRFNYFSHSPILLPKDSQSFIDTTVFNTLTELKKHWVHYQGAYEYSSIARYDFTNIIQTDLNAAVAVFDGKINYPRGVSLVDIDPTYTSAIHTSMQKYGTFLRSDILKAMAQQEVTSKHWGYHNSVNDQRRITVGGADEAGSSGFNQIQNKYAYGGKALDGTDPATICSEVSAYTAAGVSQVNHYDPGQNIVAKAVWLAAPEGNCGRSFRKAFNGNLYSGTYSSSSAVPLVKIITGTETTTVAAGNYTDDDYEKLTKALGGYNQGAGIFGGGAGKSWLSLLVSQSGPSSAAYIKLKTDYATLTKAEKSNYALITAMKYGLNVMHDSNKLGLPYRKYIWQGGAAIPDDLSTTGVDESQAAWCFEYSEEDWLVGGIKWSDVKLLAIGSLTKPAVGRVGCI